MSWSISIYGHIDGGEEEQKDAEENLVAAAKSFVKNLSDLGLIGATGSFQHLGSIDLKAE